MKQLTKATALLLALVLLVLTACGEAAPAETPGETNGQAPPAVTEDPAAAVPTTRFDMGGRNVSVACWWQYMSETGDPEPDPAEAANFHDEMLWHNNRVRIEETYNVTFTSPIIPWDDIMPTLTSSVMAGDPFADLVFLYGWMTFTALVGGLIMPASQYATSEADMFTQQIRVRPVVEFEGDIWSFTRANHEMQRVGMGINLDIINAIGAQNPVDLFNAGQWDWPALREIAVMATRDTDGDGIIDQFGLSGDVGLIVRNFITANGGQTIDPAARTENFGSPAVMEALEFVYQLFITDGVWFYDAVGDSPLGSWGRNNPLFAEGRSALFPIATWSLDEAPPITFDIAVIPFPQGPQGRGYTSMVGFGQGMTVPVGAEFPQEFFYLYEQIMSWAGDDYHLMTEEDVEYGRRIWPTEDDVQRVIHDIGRTAYIDMGMVVPEYIWVIGGFMDGWWNGTMTVAQAIETFRPVSQDRIDTAFAPMGG